MGKKFVPCDDNSLSHCQMCPQQPGFDARGFDARGLIYLITGRLHLQPPHPISPPTPVSGNHKLISFSMSLLLFLDATDK